MTTQELKKTATQIPFAAASNYNGDARLYRLSTPLEGNTHVIVSAVDEAFDTGLTETYIFPASPNGELKNWGELPGSKQGIFDHEAVLNADGYDVVPLEVN